MKSAAEIIDGTARNEQGRVRAAAKAASREAMLKAADEVMALLVSLALECDECPVGDAMMSWVKATRETAETG